ncbi:MAG: carbohydrate kinase [Salana multivorans]|uniref:class I mannose-6-phosphate isomerase n=1 Tax=Salana multivorans TaxID=120377 RepID=UPI00095C6F93|nr:carbohydrate kinase [Salana multivorans]MBN8882482.1 carbohydrate kinase [Salana multivorans]OJX95695.1 MAG: carbohydrate kinase [Micrococcales bacterium 73-15]
MHPVTLAPNQPADRFYRGGERIAAFRDGARLPAPDAPALLRTPEDWVGSCTTLFGERELGLSRLPDGRLLREAVEADPVAWLGAAHVERYGADVGLLVKLLDAGERLPVHVHPDVPFAREHLGLAHGKTEAWIVLAPCRVGLGFTRDVSREELDRWVGEQDVAGMLGAMHHLEVSPGDAVLVPAGTAHAIGAGALVVELQEPTDLSILMEWQDFAIDGPRDGHLGLGFPTALGAVDRRASSADDVRALVQARAGTRGELLPGGTAFFRADRLGAGDAWPAGFAVVVVTHGVGRLVGHGSGEPGGGVEPVEVTAGQTLLVPAAWGDVTVEDAGDAEPVELVLCRPPLP